MERQIISPSSFLIRKNGCLLFPVVPHVLDIFVVLEHVEHLLEKKAAISAHLSEAHSSVMQMYVTVELDTIIIAHRAKNCKRYSLGAVKTSVSGCFPSAAYRWLTRALTQQLRLISAKKSLRIHGEHTCLRMFFSYRLCFFDRILADERSEQAKFKRAVRAQHVLRCKTGPAAQRWIQ